MGDLGRVEASALRRLGVSHVVVDRAVFPAQVSAYPSAFTIQRLRSLSRARARARGGPTLALPRDRRGAALLARGADIARGALLRGRVAGSPDGHGRRRARHLRRPHRGCPPGRGPAGIPRASGPTGRFRPGRTPRGSGRVARASASMSPPTGAGGSSPSGRSTPGPSGRRSASRSSSSAADRSSSASAGTAATRRPIDWVLVVAADRPEPEWTYEVEALPHRLGERPDPQASGGWAGYADPGESHRTGLVSGPARLFPAGRYRSGRPAARRGAGPGPARPPRGDRARGRRRSRRAGARRRRCRPTLTARRRSTSS